MNQYFSLFSSSKFDCRSKDPTYSSFCFDKVNKEKDTMLETTNKNIEILLSDANAKTMK
jgi:hypothetical protein